MSNFLIKPNSTLQGTIKVPGDKSISHRAIMFGAIAEGITEISNFLNGADCLATMQAFIDMGVEIEIKSAQEIIVHGVGLNGLHAPHKILDLGNSGTSIRLLTGLLAGQHFSTQLTGDASLCHRPMARVVEPLRAMGAYIDMQDNGCPPLFVHGDSALHGIHYVMPVASAQVKSALLLAGLYATGETTIVESAVTRDHTERMLVNFNYPIKRDKNVISLVGKKSLRAAPVVVPSDISSAAFFIVGAAITPGAKIILEQVGVNATRTGVIAILQKMGATIYLTNERLLNGEPVADIEVHHSQLKGITIPAELVPLAIDEFPVIFIAAACAEGTTILQGAAELRVKESDRLQAMADGLAQLGIQAETTPDGIIITGSKLQGGEVNSHGDHRIAMAFAIAGLRSQDEIKIIDCDNVATSFPNFVELAQSVGMKIEIN